MENNVNNNNVPEASTIVDTSVNAGYDVIPNSNLEVGLSPEEVEAGITYAEANAATVGAVNLMGRFVGTGVGVCLGSKVAQTIKNIGVQEDIEAFIARRSGKAKEEKPVTES